MKTSIKNPSFYSNERGGILGRLLFLGLLLWGAWFLYNRWLPQHNLKHFGGRLETAVDKAFTLEGVTDRDVLTQVRKEHGWHSLSWVETQRSIQTRNPSQSQAIAQALKRVAEKFGCSYENYDVSGTSVISLKQYIFIYLQKVTLNPGPVSHAALPHSKTARVAFVIDDVAYETASMDHFASLGVPFTFAILPREKHSKELSQKANGLHFPVMLHLPMEPQDVLHNDPGPSGLYLKMSDQELKTQFDKDVASVPNIVGINNHMGSAFTESDPKMTLVLQWIKAKNIYFLDSRTSGKSVGCRVAKRLGVPCLANETFLDNEDSVAYIEKQLDLVMKLALREGQTIAIGHYRRKFLVQALANKLPEFKAHGVDVVTLPTFYHHAVR